MTSKQARADFRRRGCDPLTPRQKRELARGAELEERARRLRYGHQKRKEEQKKREDAERVRQQVERERIGETQILGANGEATGQLHLGVFFNIPKRVREETKQDRGQEAMSLQSGEQDGSTSRRSLLEDPRRASQARSGP